METKLEQLVLKNKFSDLSPEERAYVLSRISEEDFVKLHVLLIKTKQVFYNEYEELELNNEIKNHLNVAFKKKFKKQHLLNDFINIKPLFSSPILKPSIAMVGSILLFAWLYTSYNNYVLQNDIKEVTTYLLDENNYEENLKQYYSADTLENNFKIKDTLKNNFFEMNKFLNEKTQGLQTSFSTSIN
jgi:hypothetical protein